jgi:hypothetical protein
MNLHLPCLPVKQLWSYVQLTAAIVLALTVAPRGRSDAFLGIQGNSLPNSGELIQRAFGVLPNSGDLIKNTFGSSPNSGQMLQQVLGPIPANYGAIYKQVFGSEPPNSGAIFNALALDPIHESMANVQIVAEQLAGGLQRITEQFPDGLRIVLDPLAHTVTRIFPDGIQMIASLLDNSMKTIYKNGNQVIVQTLQSGAILNEYITRAGQDLITITVPAQLRQALGETQRGFDQASVFFNQTVHDVLDVNKTVIEFHEKEIQSYHTAIEDASTRLKEGKVLDAVLGAALDPMQSTSDNLGDAAKANRYVNMAGAIAASTYGGPAGSAAYSAWYVYQTTKDADLALKSAVIAGIGSAIYGSDGSPITIANENFAYVAVREAAANGVVAAASARSPDEALEMYKAAFTQSLRESVLDSAAKALNGDGTIDAPSMAAIKQAAYAGAKIAANGGSADDVQRAMLGEIASSIRSQANAAVADKPEELEKLNRLEEAILAGSVSGVGGATLNLTAKELEKRIANVIHHSAFDADVLVKGVAGASSDQDNSFLMLMEAKDGYSDIYEGFESARGTTKRIATEPSKTFSNTGAFAARIGRSDWYISAKNVQYYDGDKHYSSIQSTLVNLSPGTSEAALLSKAQERIIELSKHAHDLVGIPYDKTFQISAITLEDTSNPGYPPGNGKLNIQ